MRILGLDVGERRIGVALSDVLGLTAQRLTLLTRTSAASDVEAIRALIMQHAVTSVVVGLPITMRGAHGAQAQRMRAFAERLRRQLSIPVHLVDERLTTVQGARALREVGTARYRRKELLDQVAAQLILQYFLDAQHRAE